MGFVFLAQGMQGRQPGRKQALQGNPRIRLDQHLHALDSGHTRHRRRDRRINHHTVGLGQIRCCCGRSMKKFGSGLRGLGLSTQQGQAGEGRQPRAFAFSQLTGGERRKVMRAQCGVEGVTRMPGLDPHLADCGLPGIATGAAGGLHQQGEQALWCTKVTGEQAAVGVDRSHQCDAPEVVTLGDHLGADQHIDFARVHRPELRLEGALQARGVGIDAGHAGPRQGLGELFLKLFCAAANRLDVEVAAVGASARHALGEAAVVTAQRAVSLVEDTPGAAMRAGALPGTGAAMQHRRVAAAIEQHQTLFAAGDARLQRLEQWRRQGCSVGLLARLQAHVDQAHAGQRATADALGQVEPPVSALLGTLPALQRWCRRPEHHRHALQPAAVNRQVPRRVARTFLLLERRVMLFVHHDQAQAWHRREHGQARAEHQLGLSQVCSEPVAQSLRRRQAAVQ